MVCFMHRVFAKVARIGEQVKTTEWKRWWFKGQFKGQRGFPGGSAGKESACNVGDLGSIPALGRPPGEGKGYPLQYSGLENSMDCIVHGGSKDLDMTEWLSLSLSKDNIRSKVQWDD